jgi:hypothetical protein
MPPGIDSYTKDTLGGQAAEDWGPAALLAPLRSFAVCMRTAGDTRGPAASRVRRRTRGFGAILARAASSIVSRSRGDATTSDEVRAAASSQSEVDYTTACAHSMQVTRGLVRVGNAVRHRVLADDEAAINASVGAEPDEQGRPVRGRYDAPGSPAP